MDFFLYLITDPLCGPEYEGLTGKLSLLLWRERDAPCSPVHPPERVTALGWGCGAPLLLPCHSVLHRGALLCQGKAGHMTNTKAYGWAVSAIHHVVLLGVGGQVRRGEGDDGGGWASGLG